MKRQFCTCCLKTAEAYSTITQADGRVFHLHLDPRECRVDAERRRIYAEWFAVASINA